MTTMTSATDDLFAMTTPAQGNDNPTVSFNLSGVTDFSSQMPFLDIAKTMRTWIGHEAGQWGGWDEADLRAGGYLDENGWPTEIPAELSSISSIWAWTDESAQDSRSGTYVMTYQGEGDIVLQGNVTVLSHEEGRIVFEYTNTGNFWFEIRKTDPAATGDYIRDISIVREDHLALHEAGAMFNPEWLKLVSDSREFRFMDWMGTNGSAKTSWSDQRTVDDYTWAGDVPVDI